MLKRLFAVVLGITISFLMTGLSSAFVDDIAAAWTFEEGSGDVIHDVSGNGNDGELKGGTEWVDGRFGKVLDFDGESGYVEIPFSDNVRVLNQGDFTIALCLWFDEALSEYKGVFQQTNLNGTGRAWIRVVASTAVITWLGGAAINTGVNVAAGEWHHVAVVVTEDGNADTVQPYVNGEPAGAPVSQGMEDCEGNYLIGCHKNLDHFWPGMVDDVVLIKKALDVVQIGNLMENGIESFLAKAVEPTDKLAAGWGRIKGNL